MKELIYYPSFEFSDINWLKFALLYIKRLDSIVPVSGDKHLSDFFNTMKNETDLIKLHRPRYLDESYPASLDAMEQIEKILRNPNRYFPTFSKIKIVDIWKQKQFQNYTLFEEKYTYEFGKYCLDNNIAHKCNEGICVPKDLSYLYMTVLSNAISEFQGIPTITDIPKLHKFNIFSRKANPKEEKVDLAESIIKLNLPSNMNHIDIKDIIRLRNSKDYHQKLSAFHKELDSYCLAFSEDKNPIDFIDSLEYCLDDLKHDMIQLAPEVFTIGLGVVTLYNAVSLDILKLASEALTGIAVFSGATKIRKGWRHTESKRFTQKYLASLRRLPHNSIIKKKR